MKNKLFRIAQQDQLARIGELKTPHGCLKTPIIFPVHNLGAQGGWNTPKYWELFPNIKTAMFNAYYIFHNYRKIKEKISFAGGIHNFLGFPGVAFVDSGGFLTLRKHVSVKTEEILRIQEICGADIASTFDFPFVIKNTAGNIVNSIARSIESAKEAARLKKRKEMLLYASVHGNDPMIISNVLKHLAKYSIFDGFAVGSMIPIRSNLRLLVDLIFSARQAVPEKPLHVYGLGGILSTPLLIYLGADSFDSTSFIICGGKRQYFVPNYTYVSMKYIAKLDALPCACTICSSKTIEEIRKNRSLISLHNLWVLWHELKQIQFAIAERRLESYIKERYTRNSIALKAFEYAKRKVKRIF
ncbi:MAG: tRNA-guanine transglycosylase [Candidatus Bathyarchaeia archaeon]